jgi:hypothetical protein
MIPKLVDYLNKAVLVSIPALQSAAVMCCLVWRCKDCGFSMRSSSLS